VQPPNEFDFAMRRYRFALIVAVVVLAFGAIALNRLRQDSARLTGWLVAFVRAETGLEVITKTPGEFTFWPELRLRIEDAEVRDGGASVGTVNGLEVGIPWSSVRGGPVRLGGLSVTRIDVQSTAMMQFIERWTSADAGPPAPWNWPTLDQPVHVGALYWHAEPTSASRDWFLEDIDLDRLVVGLPTRLSLTVRVNEDHSPVPVLLVATPMKDGIDLQLSPMLLAIDPNISGISASGSFRFNHLRQGRYTGSLAVTDLSKRVVFDALDLDRPSALELDWQGTFDGRFRLRGEGKLFGEDLTADIALPTDWRNHLEPPMAIVQVLEGKIRIARLRFGVSEWDGLTIEGVPLVDDAAVDDVAAENSTADVAPTATP